jgi:hypothetical protein
MRIYLAARYDRRQEMEAIAARLEAAGHTLTSGWIYGWHESVPELVCAAADWTGVGKAECVVSFTEEPDERVPWAARGGRHVEFGLGLAMGKRLCIVGPRENVFHHLERVEVYPTVTDFIRAFGRGQAVAS